MPIKRKPIKADAAEDTGVAKAAPVASTGGGIKKRTSLPPLEPGKVDAPGELGAYINAVNKDKGQSAPFILGSTKRYDPGLCATGILAVDLSLGGGWRLSRPHMIVGERSAGKSTLSLLTAAMMQRKYPDDYIGYVDVEGTLDKPWAAKLGVDLARDRKSVV